MPQASNHQGRRHNQDPALQAPFQTLGRGRDITGFSIFHHQPNISQWWESLNFTMPPRISLPTSSALVPIRNVVSASFLYPFKGIYYFCAHREYWPLFGRRLIPLTITSIVVLGLLFTFTYLPQVAFLAIFHGPVAWFNAVFLVLGEGQVVIALLFEAFLVDETLVDVFDVCICSLNVLISANILQGNSHPRRSKRPRSTLSNPPRSSNSC